jgi:hypothetical protein
MGIALDKLTPTDLERFIHMQALVDRQDEAAAHVRSYRKYYDGDHPVFLTRRQQEYLGPLLTDADLPFNHNLVKVIIDRLRERLNVVGFTVNGESAAKEDSEDAGPAATLAGLLWQWWKENAMSRQQIRLHRRTLRDAKGYVMVDYDQEAQRPRFNLHEVDDGAVGIVFHRDPSDPNKVLFATRYFYDFDPLTPGKTGIERKTVYLPGEIRKYRRAQTGSWQPIMDDGDAAWPLPWRDRMGTPLGVPVVEFQNPGGSEVHNIAGLQNALNKAWLDLLGAQDAAGFPILVANYKDALVDIGEESDGDLEGSDELRIAPGRMLEIFGGEIKRIEASNLGSMIEVLWTLVSAMGGVSSTPQYFLKPILGIDFSSGEALKQMESALVAKAVERQQEFGESWAEVMRLAIRVADAFGPSLALPLGTPSIGVQWADPNTRMEETEAKVATAHKALNVPDEAVWAKAGYSPEQIAHFREQARANRAADVAMIAGAVQARQSRTQPQTNPQAGGA